jgi:hypothetical protein
MDSREPLKHREAMQLTDKDIIDLPDYKMDDYMDFFEDYFILPDPSDRDKDAAFQRMMLEMFPLTERSTKVAKKFSGNAAELKQETVQSTQAALKPNRILSTEAADTLGFTPTRPGVEWVHHKNHLELAGRWKTFYTILARVTGIPVKSLVTMMVRIRTLLAQMQVETTVKKRGSRRTKEKRKQYQTNSVLGTEDMMSDVRSELSDRMNIEDEGDTQPHDNIVLL